MKTWNIERVSPGQQVELSDLELELDAGYLNRLNEAERGQITFTLIHRDQALAKTTLETRMLARDEWGGFSTMGELLAAFVMPNDPAIARVLKKTSAVLARNGQDDSLEGYQKNDPQRAYLLGAALWNALAEESLIYSNPPKSFERIGQKTRRPAAILEESLATCLDTSLLFASALESIGLNSALLMIDGHCYVGFWLVERTFDNLIEPDASEIRKAIAAKEFIPFETTLITKRPPVQFDEAIQAAKKHSEENREDQFLGAIDIARARMSQIRPLASHEETASKKEAKIAHQAPASSLPLPEPPVFDELPGMEVNEKPPTPEGRVERWQRKLLDLSLRNRLLNFRPTKQTVPFLCPDVHLLEDKLADGKTIKLISLPESNPHADRDAKLHFENTGQDLDVEFATQALDRNELASLLTKTDLDTRLTKLYRAARNDLAEGGTNTLFLATGFLKWKRNPQDEKSYRAPLLLVPVKLERKSALSQFKLKHHEDDVRFNSTLIQMLKKDFGRDLSRFESDLPKDESGVDVPRVLQMMREQVREIPGFEVVDETALSTFSFSKYLMWKDLVDRTGHLEENRVVKHLIRDPDKVFQSGVSEPISEPHEIDVRFNPDELVHPLSADSSQLAAIMAAAQGHDFVLIGPPGTGKSQTIANMIAQCLFAGKSVLFVAEKTAALDVVYRRLCQHGLGNVCLELHSNKAERRKFLAQLKESWETRARGNQNEWIEVNEKLKIHRDQLNRYVEALHEPDESGWSVYRAMGISVSRKDQYAPALNWPATVRLNRERYQSLASIAKDLGTAFREIDHSPELESIQATRWSASWEGDLLESCEGVRSRGDELKAILLDYSRAIGLTGQEDCSPHMLEQYQSLAQLLIDSAETNYRIVFDKEIKQIAEEIKPFAKKLASYQKAKKKLQAEYDEKELERIPLDELDLNWRKANATFWPLSYFGKRKVQKFLQSYATRGEAHPGIDLAQLRTMQQLYPELVSQDLLTPLPMWKGLETDFDEARVFLKRAVEIRRALMEFGKRTQSLEEFSSRVSRVVIEENSNHPLVELSKKLLSKIQHFERAIEKFERGAEAKMSDSSDHFIASRQNLVQAIQNQRTQLKSWMNWQEKKHLAREHDLKRFVDALEAGSLSPDESSDAFELAFVRWWLPLAIDRNETLRSFQRFHHEELIDNFRKLDERAREVATQHVRGHLKHQLPQPEKVPKKSELGLLRHQMGLKRPSKSIREVISKMPETFPKLAPCVLMSPLSIAQYFPAEQDPFDVVIFDEASQITTWDAIGAIARGRQTIVVGDPKQLPPTNFFGQVDTDEDNDEIEDFDRDLESILDEGIASGLPVRNLNWHYRSQHESLIAFSNQNYYDNSLVTFPSTATEDRAVSLCHLPDAIYDRGSGKSHTNRREAEKLVADGVERMKSWLSEPEEFRPTLGVITFNSQQQSLIQDLFDEALRENPQLEWFFDESRIEPTVVKNLENVQGDERDVMLFSITYGPDRARRDTGDPGANFGPLNRQGGERRLNVAVTRARQELIVYCSFLPDQLRAERTKYQGVKDLKSFLSFAQKGSRTLVAGPEESIGEHESPFEEAVAAGLNAKGWQIVPQIGVSTFRIDLGVVRPDCPDTFLAGVECDGATYHRSATARDRDKIREQVLRGLGWSILRVWSPDWWYDPEGALARIDDELNELLETYRVETERQSTNTGDQDKSAEASDADAERLPEQGKFSNGDDLPSYLADLKADSTRFYDEGYTEHLREIIDVIVNQEAPIREDRIAQLVARIHGWKRTGKRISERVASCLDGYTRSEESTGDFIWHTEEVPQTHPYRPTVFYTNSRSVDEISLAELCGFINEHADLLKEEDPAFALSRELGMGRLPKTSRARLEEAIGVVRSASSLS